MAESKPTAVRLVPVPAEENRLEARSDDELMLLARDGRREAFHVLVRRHQARALAIGTRYLGSSQLSREAAQNAFVELFRALPRYQPRGRFTAYWHQLHLNQCRMAARTLRAVRATDDEYGRLAPPPPVLADDALIAVEQRREVERALGELSEKLRVVLALRFAGGLSLQEVAAALELPLGTVKSRLFAGLAELRQALRGVRP